MELEVFSSSTSSTSNIHSVSIELLRCIFQHRCCERCDHKMTTRHRRGTDFDDEEANYDEEDYHQLISEHERYRDSSPREDSNKVHSADELFEFNPQYDRAILTGRMRKKQAARSKGGEFQARRQKRRVYFCCISSEVDVQELHEHCTNEIFELKSKWKTRLYGDALCLSKLRTSESSSPCNIRRRQVSEPSALRKNTLDRISDVPEFGNETTGLDKKEVFVFEFGAVVFWGFSVSEEKHLLEVFRDFSKRGLIADKEFVSGEDDMAFVVSTEVTRINVANDVIVLPEGTTTKQRLSVSYAIAQSSVVSIFEYRIEKKVEEYKFIPETLAQVGIIDDVSSQRVGMMIGDIFVIRHDLNLHTDILDTPDYFWGEEDVYEEVYERVMKYLEMESRVDVINRRLDMLKELLDVLHQQMENAHSTKLEWIIIWLIVLEVIIQVVGIVGGVMGLWVW
jgi:uncharacterized Rmd1/YagE family protein